MTVKAENRFKKHNREYFDRLLEEKRSQAMFRTKEERLAGKWFDQYTRDFNAISEENEQLKERVAKLEAGYKKRGVYLTVERENGKQLHAKLENEHKSALDWFRAFQAQERAHQKLSAIVRLALSPEKFHEWREVAARNYPNLFKKD